MSKYKINLHAHTFFSDGKNSPYVMAILAERLGFSALVIADHYYSSHNHDSLSLNPAKFKLLKRAVVEAKELLPVIVGIELAAKCLQEEILCFGSAFIQEIMSHEEELTIEKLVAWKRTHYGACILCHPGNPENHNKLLPLIDGFERYNSGQDWFSGRAFGVLETLPHWSNSDAHEAGSLRRGWNGLDSKITTEVDLIKYIRSGKQPECHNNPREK